MKNLPSYMEAGKALPVLAESQPAIRGYRLLTRPEGNPKTHKGEKLDYLTFPLHLLPASASGVQMCHWTTKGCEAGCLHTAGNPAYMSGKIRARTRRTEWFNNDRTSFMLALLRDIERAQREATHRGYKLALRLNATSDVLWERIPVGGYANLMEAFPAVTFYDYSKAPAALRATRPSNYHLTFSRAESNEKQARRALASGMNVAVVFRNKHHPDTFWDHPVVNGDEHDLRFLDPANSIIALKAKGKARYDVSGFVLDVVEKGDN